MTNTVRALIPIRSFDGMTRLSDRLTAGDRTRLARDLAARATSAALDAGTQVQVITGEPEVRRWAIAAGVGIVDEHAARGLNSAAATGTTEAGQDPWLLVHADLPAIEPDDVRAAVQALGDGYVLAPSHDGGTSLIAGRGSGFPFRYGPGSFRRHLVAINGDATILIRPGLALDLDRPWDLDALKSLGYL